MSRYFLEVAYDGSGYSGFQSQQNANTIQAEIEKAISILLPIPGSPGGELPGSTGEADAKEGVRLTGSSRTDAGVHAMQNYFHIDMDNPVRKDFVYKINAILPGDIVVKQILPVADDAHCRFDAISREYKYVTYAVKNPFLKDRAYYFPYKLDFELLCQAADILKEYDDFTSFSKRNTQVKSFICRVEESRWYRENDCLVYLVKANRFLRGMVRGLTGTMLKLGRGKLTIDQFREIIEARDCTRASFAVPARGLFLVSVTYPPGVIEK